MTAPFNHRFCAVCMKLEPSPQALLAHIKTRHLLSSPDAKRVERQIFICHDCSHVFFNKDLLALHIAYSHQTKKQDLATKRGTCPRCFKSIRLQNIMIHLNNHNIPSAYVCEICLKAYPSQEVLDSHIISHQSHFSCEMCAYRATEKGIFDAHLRLHREREIERHADGLRQNMFEVNRLYQFHYNLHHATTGLRLPHYVKVCALCREICTSDEETAEHVLRDHYNSMDNTPKYNCECGADFEHRVFLRQHILKEHILKQQAKH